MKIHQIKGYIQTIFLVEYTDKLLLLDSGCRCDVLVVKRFIENELQRSFADLKLVLVSHIHPDHAGGAKKYQSSYDIDVAMHPKASLWYSGVSGLKNLVIDKLLTFYVAHKMKRGIRNIFYSPFIKPNICLDQEMSIPGFEDWKVINTPGHTETDLSFYHPKTGTIYIGDNIIKVRNNFIIPHPVSFPKLYRASLLRYREMNISAFLLAHGGRTEISNEQIKIVHDNVKDTPVTNSKILKRVLKNLKKKR